MADRASKRKHRRWWWVLACIVLVLGGLWWLQQRAAHGALYLVTQRTFPDGGGVICSAAGIGYPAVENEQPINKHGLQRAVLLDDRCQPTRWKTDPLQRYNLEISPRRSTVMWCGDLTKAGQQVHLLQRDGTRRHATFNFDHNFFPRALTEDGRAFVLYHDGAFTATGQRIPLPPGRTPAWEWRCDDPRYLALQNTKGDTLSLYDWAKQRVALTAPLDPLFGTNRGMIFTDHQRTAIIPAQGRAMVYDGTKCLFRYGNGTFTWRWGEDGTVWNLYDYQCLRWRSGPVSTVPMPVEIAFDPDYYKPSMLIYFGAYHFARSSGWGEASPALWHDGELGASAQTVPLLPESAQTLVYRLGQKLKHPLHERFIGRELTLYRRGKPIGRYAIRPPKPLSRTVVVPPGSIITSPRTPPARSYTVPPNYAEHLAFIADGRYLCWLVQSSGHPLQMYVFQVR